MTSSQKLSDYGMDTFSQFGEDGIIQKIFEIIGANSKICVEFGAWNGVFHSNTARLWKNGWKALLIERDPSRFLELKKSTEGCDCICINKSVSTKKPDTLDEIASTVGLPKNIDLLSIDIDGDDYYIFDSLQWLFPRVVICEYNPTIPPDIELVPIGNNHFGCSALALVNLAEKKGYKLVAVTDTNCFFVQAEEFVKFSEFNTQLVDIMPRNHISYLITGYDGDFAAVGNPPYGINYPTRQRMVRGHIRYLPILNLRWVKNKAVLKEYLASSSLYPFLFRLRGLVSKRVGPPPQLIKQKIIRKYARDNNLRVFIETGTYRGDTVAAVERQFDEVHSIELSDELYNKARKRFAKKHSITIHHGDSMNVLPEILSRLSQPALFWLDGHYSGNITARGKHETPIRFELKAILNHRVKTHIILIDDARCFNGSHDYPTIEELRSLLDQLRPGSELTIAEDIIRITLR